MNNTDIRLAPGELTANELLSDDSTLVVDWARTDDMLNTAWVWSATQPDKGLQAEIVKSLGIGGGGYYGGFNGLISIFVATPQMRQYIFETLMDSSPVAPVTAFLHVPNSGAGGYDFDEYQVVYGQLISSIATNPDSDYTRFDDKIYHTLQFTFERAEIVNLQLLVNENDAYIVDENGAFISPED